MSEISVLMNITELGVGVLWALFGSARDIRVRGVAVPAWAQALLRFAAPIPFAWLLLIMRPASSNA